jgi:hypothetical protein
MNIVERLIEHDLADTRRMLERAQTLTAKQLDAKLADPQPRLFLECFEPTIRGRLDYLVLTKECWLAAVHALPSPVAEVPPPPALEEEGAGAGGSGTPEASTAGESEASSDRGASEASEPCPPIQGRDRTPDGMLKRWSAVENDWRELVSSVESEGRWDEMFIDALCEQPVTFSFGGMIAHVLDMSSRQRAELFRAFTALGHGDVCYGDPLTWEQRPA